MDTFKKNQFYTFTYYGFNEYTVVYNCFSIIRGYVTAIYVMFYWKISYKHFF